MLDQLLGGIGHFFLFLGPGGTASVLIGTTASIIAWHALHTGAAVNLRNKRVDVIVGCSTRYDSLSVTKAGIIKEISKLLPDQRVEEESSISIPKSITNEIDLYHRRYWGLKSDQVDYWLAGYVDPETLISWFMSTIEAIHSPAELWRDYAGTAGGGWGSVKSFHEITNKRLYQIVELISAKEIWEMIPERRYAYLFDLFCEIEREERGLINMLKRNDHARLTMDIFRANLTSEVAKHVVPHELRAMRERAFPTSRKPRRRK